MADPNNQNNSIQGGEVESNGFEVSLAGNITKGLNVIAGYSHNSSDVTEDTEDGGYLGFRPEEAGPENMFNFWANYKVPSGALKNFGMGLGANYASEHKTLNRDVTGTFTLPDYTILNAVLSYTGQNFNVNLKFDNLLDQEYYSGWSTVTPQKLRSVSLGLAYAF